MKGLIKIFASLICMLSDIMSKIITDCISLLQYGISFMKFTGFSKFQIIITEHKQSSKTKV